MSSSLEIGYIIPKKNSVNGVGPKHLYYNASDKVMKYITFTYIPYNSVNDVVQCTVNGKTEASGKLTGPIAPGSFNAVEWDVMWYNPTITKIKLVSIHIEYMDGSEEMIDGKDVTSMDDKNSKYYAMDQKRKSEELVEQNKKIAENSRKNDLCQAYYSFKVLTCFKKMKDDEEMKFHVNQGLWLFILEVIGLIFGIAIPDFGFLVLFAAVIIAFIFASKCIKGINTGERYEIPLISKIRLIK